MTVAFTLDLETRWCQNGQTTFSSVQTHSGPTALPGPLKWSVTMTWNTNWTLETYSLELFSCEHKYTDHDKNILEGVQTIQRIGPKLAWRRLCYCVKASCFMAFVGDGDIETWSLQYYVVFLQHRQPAWDVLPNGVDVSIKQYRRSQRLLLLITHHPSSCIPHPASSAPGWTRGIIIRSRLLHESTSRSLFSHDIRNSLLICWRSREICFGSR